MQSISVPLAYGPKQKWLLRIRQDPDLNKPVSILLPRIGFELIDLSYDGERKHNSTNKRAYIVEADNNGVRTQFTPVPYNFNFAAYIMAKNADDAMQIIEQIIPFFSPEFTSSVKLIPEMDIKMDIPVVITSITMDDTYEGDFETRRALIMTINFQLKGYIYGPVSTGAVIKQTTINFTPSVESGAKLSSVVKIQPGLLANGSPTTDSSLSIPYRDINANDDWGFAVDV